MSRDATSRTQATHNGAMISAHSVSVKFKTLRADEATQIDRLIYMVWLAQGLELVRSLAKSGAGACAQADVARNQLVRRPDTTP